MSSASSNTDRIRAIYDGLAPNWDQREACAERFLIGKAMRKELARHLQGDVLELGSGTGATFPFLDWDAVTSLTATDLSGGMLEEARRHEAIVDRPVTFNQVDASALPFGDATFDTVTTSLLLCTVPDPEGTLREMSRVARPGGRIVILEHVRAHNRLLAGTQRLLSPAQQRRMGCHLDRATDNLVREMGFTIVDHRTRFFGVFHLLVLEPLGVDHTGS
jgi:ubiquinone/menaquinone biosynthesis C-methylase UbiE